MAHDVFVSYSVKDKKLANTVCSFLESKKIRCWIAPRDVTPGIPFAEAIIDGINESKVFILIYSSHSNQSHQVSKEVCRAVHHGIPIIPLRIENVPVSKQLEYYISDVHWLDALNPPMKKHIYKLAEVVRRVLSMQEMNKEGLEEVIHSENTGQSEIPKTKNNFRTLRILLPAFILLVIAAVLFFLIMERQQISSFGADRVFTAAFENRTGDSSLDPIGRLVSDWIIQGIINNELAEVITTSTMLNLIQSVGTVRGGLADRQKLIELAKITESGILISGMFQEIGQQIQFHTQIIDVKNNEIILTLEPVRGSRSEPMQAINELQQKIMGALAIHVFPGMDLRVISEPPIYDAYLEHIEGIKYFGFDYEKAFKHFHRAVDIDPNYIEPKLWMAIGYGNLELYAQADSILQFVNHERHRLSPFERYYLDWYSYGLQGRLEESLAMLLQIESIAPMDAGNNYLIGYSSLTINKPGKTIETFAKMDFHEEWADIASWSWRFDALCNAHHMLGNYQKEIEVAVEGQKYFPNDLYLRANEARALAALGRINQLYNVIEESKLIQPTAGSVGYVMFVASEELRAHEYKEESIIISQKAIEWYKEHDPRNKDKIARLLYITESWVESYTLYKELFAQNPENFRYKGALGALAVRMGNEGEARRIANTLKSLDGRYLFGEHTYLRARIHALLGEYKEAVQLIEESFKQGREFGLYIHCDIDFEALHNFKPFQELLIPRG